MKGIKKGLAILLVLCTLLSMVVMTGAGVAGDSTNSQPFAAGTGGSQNFRIPALVTLPDGTLVAAADARWNGVGDAGGIDTMVSRSTDGGRNWTSFFANYLGDNNERFNKNCATFIDPALAYSDKNNTLYMLVDLYVAGYALNTADNLSQTGSGFTEDGYLKLKSSSDKDYNYYLKDGSIYNNITNQKVEDYTVDAYFNIKGDDGTSSNLFYANTPYQAYPTTYLYLTKSTDNGATWGAPKLLNVKNDSEGFYGVGPGRGLVTSTGRIIFACYKHPDEFTSFIYSDDDGETWKRTVDLNKTSSEATLVEADDKLYAFTRTSSNDNNWITYYTSTDYGKTWSNETNDDQIDPCTSCQMNAITYSKKIDGKTAILLSCPTGSTRANGKIFVGLVQDNGSIVWKYNYRVNRSTYQYSSLTELEDGSIGLLYENGRTSITYTNLPISTVAPNATIADSTETPAEPATTKPETITLYVGQEKTVTVENECYNDYSGNPDPNIATVNVTDNEASETTTYTEASVSCNNLISGNNSSWQKTDYYYTPDNGANYYPVYAMRSASFRYIYYIYTYTWGYSTTGSASNVNQIETQKTIGTGDTPNIPVYTKSTVTTPASTTITFTGKAVGVTSVIVGETTYEITVNERPPVLDIETTPFKAAIGQGNGQPVTKLTTSVGLSFNLGLNTDSSDVTWSVGDPSIATVDNGVVTGVKAGETTVTATIDGVAYTIPVVIRQDASSADKVKIYDMYLSEVTDTTVYYCLLNKDKDRNAADLVETQEGEAIYISVKATDNTALDFFAKPDEGYALTRMSSTNSANQYMALNGTSPTDTDFCKTSGAAGEYQINSLGNTLVYKMVQNAMDKGCDGGMGFTRPSNNADGAESDLTFRSEKLPTVDKTIATVNGQPYTPGMTAKANDVIVYNVTVTQYAAQDAITYTNASLTDNLPGATFNNNTNATGLTLSDTALATDQVNTYQVTYTIQDADLDKMITNTVDLTYTYKSAYSSGSFGGSARAEAQISAPTFTPQDIVIDFGLPVTIDYRAAYGRYALRSGTATYGDVKVENNVVTYTPNTVLKNVDTVTLTNTEGGTTTFKVYPATTVYYEEGFATYSGDGWTGGSKGTGTQTASAAADTNANYGFDAKYAVEATGSSNGTQATSNTPSHDRHSGA